MGEQPKNEGAQALKEIGGFELVTKIGQGGMGAVFKARQKSLDRIVALKVLPRSIAKDTQFIQRFQREARASAKLNHPHIVQGIDVGQDDATGLWYFAMEYVEGPTLKQVLSEQKMIPEEQALRIVRDIAAALECVAKHGMVHRDIKPDNILLDSRGDPKLADLGLARQANEDSTLTQSGQALGTPFYMAPEQVRGRSDQFDVRTDIYALGGTLFHLVTGQTPYTGSTGAVIMSKHLTEPVPNARKVNPEVSDGCSRLIERMMQKERDRRFQTPADLITQIERVLRGEATTGPTPPIKSNVTTHRKKEPVGKPASRVPLALVGAGVLIAAVVAGVLLTHKNEEPAASSLKDATPAAQGSHAAAAPAPAPPLTVTPKGATKSTARPTESTAPASPTVAPVAAPVTIPDPTQKPETPARPTLTPAAAPVAVPEATKKTEAQANPTPVPKPAPAAAPEAPTQRAEWPMAEILGALRENSPQKAAERVRDGNYPAKDAMLDALKLLAAQREARHTAINNLVGQNVKLDSVKGPQNGKLVSFKNGALQLERAIVINGESRGSTQATVAMDDLTPATLERLAPIPAPTAPVDWVAAALTAMAASQLDAADGALTHLAGSDLREPLAAELKRTRVRDREAQARAAWAKIEARAAGAPSQASAKQLVEELAAFAKKFADSDLAATPEVAAKALEMKEKFERLSLGLDPRVLKLFKGRVVNYDARTQIITLGYDFTTKEQTDDFIDSNWALPGDHTGLTWKKGELRTFCKGTADRVLSMPQFVSGTLTIQLDCRRIDTSRRNRFEVEVSFFGLESVGKSPKMSFRASEKGSYFLNAGAEAKSNLDEIMFRKDGTLELSCQGQALVAKANGKVVLEHKLSRVNDHSGFWIGGGWDSGVTFTKLQVSGRLDHGWLAKALESAPKAR